MVSRHDYKSDFNRTVMTNEANFANRLKIEIEIDKRCRFHALFSSDPDV